MDKVILNGKDLTIEEVVKVAVNGVKVEVDESAISEIKRARKVVDEAVSQKKKIYGLTTGFGKFSDVAIDEKETAELQKNLIRSHACGVGRPLEKEIVRAVMLLRINALSKGISGIKVETVNTLVEMLNKEVHPVIPRKGSLGSSGDLAPLAHMVLVMMGEGEAEYKGEIISGESAMKLAGISPVELSSKEGLALINGTQVQTAVGLFACYNGMLLSKYSDIISALTFEALRGITCALDERIHIARNQIGQINTAKNLTKLLEGSKYTTVQGELRMQDAYSLRCVPQIHGASKDALEYVWDKIEKEINAATDNPLIFPEDGAAISGGNFHGQPMALAFDFLAIALSELANVSERRIERLVNPALSNELPAFLVKDGGLNSGFMIMQYSAAALVSENKVLSHPASVDSIPSSANQEDHVSMGTIAAVKALEVMDNLRKVLAIEYLSASQAIDLRETKEQSAALKIVYDELRKVSLFVDKDRIMYTEINKAEKLLSNEELIKKVEATVGKLM